MTKRRGRKPGVVLGNLLSTLVFHVMNQTGTLAEHFAMLFEDSLNQIGCANRRAGLPWEVFADLMRPECCVLWPRRGRHPDAYWRDCRLRALDGTQFSVTNTPAEQRHSAQGQGAVRACRFCQDHHHRAAGTWIAQSLAAATGHKVQSEA